MNISHKIKTFNDRYPLIGPAMWILTVEYFIVQLIVAADWSHPYSLSNNTISDLGNSSCGLYGNRYVCSPLHNLMNASLIVLGLFMIFGSLLIYQEFKKNKLSLVGFSSMLIAGVGTAMVGLFPENTVSLLHYTGALMPFLVGNIGIVILGSTLDLPRSLRYYTLITGIVALISLPFFISKTYLGIGEGGIERVVAYPQTIWLIVFGLYMSKSHYARLKNNNRQKTIAKLGSS
jgi:hypothetical membrane protein